MPSRYFDIEICQIAMSAIDAALAAATLFLPSSITHAAAMLPPSLILPRRHAVLYAKSALDILRRCRRHADAMLLMFFRQHIAARDDTPIDMPRCCDSARAATPAIAICAMRQRDTPAAIRSCCRGRRFYAPPPLMLRCTPRAAPIFTRLIFRRFLAMLFSCFFAAMMPPPFCGLRRFISAIAAAISPDIATIHAFPRH